jgi:hypothetical protein
LVVGGWWLVVGGWWLVVGGWWLVVGGWWLAGGWWLVASGRVYQSMHASATARGAYVPVMVVGGC